MSFRLVLMNIPEWHIIPFLQKWNDIEENKFIKKRNRYEKSVLCI